MGRDLKVLIETIKVVIRQYFGFGNLRMLLEAVIVIEGGSDKRHKDERVLNKASQHYALIHLLW
jgi:hypothetical protein